MKKKNIEKNLYFNDYKINIFKRILYGIFMSFSDVIPGYSGGTSLSILGFFEELILKIKIIFQKNKFKNWFKNILWLLPFVIFWISFIFLFSFLSKELIKINLDWVLYFLFFSFSIFCIPSYLKSNKLKLKIIFKNDKKSLINFIYIILGTILILTISIIIYFNGGVSLKSLIDLNYIQPSIQWLIIIISALIGGFCMLIPGISGSYITFLFGTYDEIYFVVLHNLKENIVLFILIILSIIMGIILSVFFSYFLIKRYRNFFNNFCLGMVITTPISLMLATLGNDSNLILLKNNFQNFSISTNNFDITIIYIFLGIVFSLFLSSFLYWYSKRNKERKVKSLQENDMIVIVDMQNDFSKRGKIPIRNFNSISNKIDCLINSNKNFPKIQITISQDLHPKNHFSFKVWGEHCVTKTFGSSITNKINYYLADIFFIKKGTDIDCEEYSIFTYQIKYIYEEYLKIKKIKRVFVVGVMSDVCIKETILDFKRRNIDVYCIKNLCSTNKLFFSFKSILKKEKILFF